MNKKAFLYAIIITAFIPAASQEIIWSQDNNSLPLGSFDDALAKTWFASYWAAGPDEGRGAIVNNIAITGNAIRALYPKGGITTDQSGLSWNSDINGNNANELWLTYYIYFPSNFDWKHGGKLPGLQGSRAYHDGNFRWSGRLMWREEGLCQWYLHGTQNASGDEVCQIDWLDMPNHGDSALFVKGEWNKVELYYKMNTTPGDPEGSVLIGYLNSVLCSEVRDYVIFWNTGESGSITDLFFSTFFGGSSDPDFYAPLKDEYVYFDDFYVSTERIDTSTGIISDYVEPAATTNKLGNLFLKGSTPHFACTQSGIYEFKLFTIQGKNVAGLPPEYIQKGTTRRLRDMRGFGKGAYICSFLGNNNRSITQRIVIK